MIKKAKKWQELMEQRKGDNRGAAVVITIVAIALLSFMVAMLLVISFYNYRMKVSDLKGKKTFYTAETAMEEIRTGLRQDVSEAFTSSYLSTMESYVATTPSARNQLFQNSYIQQLQYKIQDSFEPERYSVDYLNSFLKKTKFDDTTNIGAKLEIPADTNIMQPTKAGLCLYDVIVKYYDKEGYVSEIKTDIILQFPNVDFAQEANSMEFLQYALIADDTFDVSGGATVNVAGSAYAGENGANIDGSTVNFTTTSSNREMLITNGALLMRNGAHVGMNRLELWAKDMVLDTAIVNVTDSNTYVSNDVVLNNSYKNTVELSMSGSLYAYGNIDAAQEAQSLLTKTSDINKNPASYSSAILVNGSGAKLNLQNLISLKIAGNSYVAASEKNAEINPAAGEENEDIQMGESISIKSNQTAYLVPAQCVKGGSNPMTAKKYAEVKGSKDLVDFNQTIEAYGASLGELGVSDYKVVCYPVRKIGSMVCVFMVFNTEEQATEFFQKYYGSSRHLASLQESLDTYTYYGLSLPDDMKNSSDLSLFYYGGNVVVNEDTEVEAFYRNKTVTATDRQALQTEQRENYDDFACLGRKLRKNREDLSLAASVYDNLVKEMTSSNTKRNIASGQKKSFVTMGANPIGAVLVNGDYVLNSTMISGKDAQGTQVSDAKLCLVIASGDVDVNLPGGVTFEGLILAGGKITINGNKVENIKSAPADVAVVLNAQNPDGVKPLHYLENVLDVGDSEELEVSGEAASINNGDLVAYKNWKKQ